MTVGLSALVTTFNEADTIGSLVAALRVYVDDVLVVNDPYTTDETEQVAAAAGAATLTPDQDEAGIGPCLLAGMRRLRGQRIVVIDAGGSHDPADIPDMAVHREHIVVGSRFVPGADYRGRPLRKHLSRLYSQACSRATTYRLHDWTSGFRVYSPAAVWQILSRPPTARFHGFQPASLAICLEAGLSYREHPISYRAGRSSMSTSVASEALRVLGKL